MASLQVFFLFGQHEEVRAISLRSFLRSNSISSALTAYWPDVPKCGTGHTSENEWGVLNSTWSQPIYKNRFGRQGSNSRKMEALMRKQLENIKQDGGPCMAFCSPSWTKMLYYYRDTVSLANRTVPAGGQRTVRPHCSADSVCSAGGLCPEDKEVRG